MAAQGEPQSHGDALERLAKVGTYRTLGEQKLSPQEERFEKARRTIGLFLAPAVFLIFFLLPLDMDETQQKLAAALLFVIVLWISEAVPIPIGGLMGIVLIVLIGVAPVDDVLAPFGSSTVFVFIGAFIIAQAMLRHGRGAPLRVPRAGRARRRQELDAHDHRVRPHHLRAVGVRLEHRHGGDAAADRDRDPRHAREHLRPQDATRARRSTRPACVSASR